ncbi:MAG: butyrate kinase [Eubacteriaceae bacterium]
MKKILAINPGSTSTKIEVFQGKKTILKENIFHKKEELLELEAINAQLDYRYQEIKKQLDKNSLKGDEFMAVVGRGGLLRPIASGTYLVNEKMLNDLKNHYGGEHASNLGGQLAKIFGESFKVPSYIVDPVSVDEFSDLARISGLPELTRISLVHALNIRGVAHRIAKEKGIKFDELNAVVAHLGGGFSIAPLKGGKIVDVNNAYDNGPFSPERAGTLPALQLVKLAFSGKYTFEEMKNKMTRRGGLVAYLDTNNVIEVEKRIDEGDAFAKEIYDAMIYQIAKEIGGMATVLKGNLEMVILTGGLAYSETLIREIKSYIGYLGEVVVSPGEDEMASLRDGVLRIINGEERVKTY